MMEKKHYAMFGMVTLCLVLLGMFISPSTPTDVPPTDASSVISYEASVCTTHTRDGVELMSECSHNLFTDSGRNATRDILGTSVNLSAFNYIALCNMTASAESPPCLEPRVNDTELEGEYSAGGLSRALSTYTELSATAGNWTISTTFTATADDLTTNTTGLFNDSALGILFAENTFTTVTLQTDDQLTINWTIQVT